MQTYISFYTWMTTLLTRTPLSPDVHVMCCSLFDALISSVPSASNHIVELPAAVPLFKPSILLPSGASQRSSARRTSSWE